MQWSSIGWTIEEKREKREKEKWKIRLCKRNKISKTADNEYMTVNHWNSIVVPILMMIPAVWSRYCGQFDILSLRFSNFMRINANNYYGFGNEWWSKIWNIKWDKTSLNDIKTMLIDDLAHFCGFLNFNEISILMNYDICIGGFN